MKYFRLLPLLVCFAGCDGLFGIDIPPIDDSQQRSGAGGAGPLGTSGAPAAGEPSSDGGEPGVGVAQSGGTSGDEAGATGGAAPGGVTGGTGATTGATSGVSGAMAAGSGGEAGAENGGADGAAGSPAGNSGRGGSVEDSYPVPNTPCEREGAAACVRKQGSEFVYCTRGVWSRPMQCDEDQLCDSRTGACSEPYPGCADETGGYAFCSDDSDTLVTCGPDLVTAVVEPCVFGCNAAERSCELPPSGSLTVEETPPIDAGGSYWPGPSLPVCFGSPQVGDEWEVVEDEVERTWGRYASLRFDGFDACSENPTGVIVKFRSPDEPCTSVLGGIDRIGYPGVGGNVTITLCLAYDQPGGSGPTSEGVLRLVARHEFGHALGFDDLSEHAVSNEFMSRGIDGNHPENYPFDTQHISPLQQAYGLKPSGAFVDVRGFCLTTGTSPPSFSSCDGSSAQAFHFENDQLHGEGDDTCLRASPAGTLSFVACTPAGSSPDPAQTFHPNPSGVELQGYGGLCLYAYEGVTVGDLKVRSCSKVGPSGAFELDLLEGGKSFRLRDRWDYCLAVQDSATTSVQIGPLTCDRCDEDVRCDFEFTNAEQIAIDDFCLAMPGIMPAPLINEDGFSAPGPELSDIEIDPCSLSRRMAWSLSGSFVNGNGQVLAVRARQHAYELIAVPAGADPTTAGIDTETFDYYLRHE